MLRDAFPYLLNIKWIKPDNEVTAAYNKTENVISGNEADPLTMCKMFLGEVNEDEEKMLTEVINELNANEKGGN